MAKELTDGLYPVEVDVLMVIKGQKKFGKLKIATIYPMTPGTNYMLASMGGFAYGTDFLALPELSVVALPETFDPESLKGKSPKEQVQAVSVRYLFEVERALEPLQAKKALLEKGLKDWKGNVFQSTKNVNITEVHDATTKGEGSKVYLDFKAAKLLWSHADPGTSGYLYFCEVGKPHSVLWEFSPSKDLEVSDVDGRPLEVRFYGMYTPGRKQAFPQSSDNCIPVRVGQMVLARTVQEPRTIYILKIESQDKKEERMSVKYTVVRD